jgi:hypothetical protein
MWLARIIQVKEIWGTKRRSWRKKWMGGGGEEKWRWRESNPFKRRGVPRCSFGSCVPLASLSILFRVTGLETAATSRDLFPNSDASLKRHVSTSHKSPVYLYTWIRTTGVRFSAREGTFSFRHHVQTGSGPTQPPVQWIPGALSSGIKRPDFETDYSPASSAEVKT